MTKRDAVKDPMVYKSPCASFEDDALAVLLARAREREEMHSLVNSHRNTCSSRVQKNRRLE